MRHKASISRTSLLAALLTPWFLGMNPIFGKAALQNGADPFTVAALRTVLAVGLIWLVYYVFWRRYLYIYPAGLMSCVAIGAVNGIGSLMYYNGLNLLTASTAQLINAMYLVFVVILTRVGGQRIGWRTSLRVSVALFSILLITGGIEGQANWLGIGLMMGSALLFAGTVVMSQRALYDMPAQTVTFYVLATMAVVVTMARVAYGLPLFPKEAGSANIHALWAILGLASTTALSRLLMFLGVKGLGSIQTTLLVILEMAVSVTAAFVFLGEDFTAIQWWGVGLLLASLIMPTERLTPDVSPTEYLPNITHIRLWQIAFSHAFVENRSKISTQEMRTIQEMFKQDKFATQEIRAVQEMLDRE